MLSIWKRHIDGTGEVQMTTEKQSVGFPSWSPNGRWLAAEVDQGGGVRAAVMPVTGGPLRLLTEGSGQDFIYTWSPDSSKLSFAGYRKGVWILYRVDVNTRAIRQLTSYDSPAGFVRYPTW